MSSFSYMLTVITYAPAWMKLWMVYRGGLNDFIYTSDVCKWIYGDKITNINTSFFKKNPRF